ncbi:AraC family transcriptional regulator [Steroidobacter flavus]|uniref:AraC family transcriptional regulator n=1 Tax=Steroidobacter flavus TaxID=1842136 RepID=A0ABV8T3H2_9GAMM
MDRKLDAAMDAEFPDTGTAMVRVDALRKFVDVVLKLGGDPKSLLAKVQIDPAILNHRHAVMPYRSLVLILEHAAAELRCPDFGMRLATTQGGIKVLGPLEFAMRNSRTLREAFRYCAEHVHVYSTASQMRIRRDLVPDSLFFQLEISLPRLPQHPQSVERALLLVQDIAAEITQGRVRPREVWMAHQPLSSVAKYREYFGADVRFGQAADGLVFTESDLDVEIPNPDAQIYALSTDFIEQRFPSADAVLEPRVRTIVERLLAEGDCTHAGVATLLGMHPRTLQRRLRLEGSSVESIKDRVRRELALRHLKQSTMPLSRIAKLLGYSETSALSRSCYRWFGVSPRQIRSGALPNGGGDEQTKESA